MEENVVLIARAMCIALNQDPDQSARLPAGTHPDVTEIGPRWRLHVPTVQYLLSRKRLAPPPGSPSPGYAEGQ